MTRSRLRKWLQENLFLARVGTIFLVLFSLGGFCLLLFFTVVTNQPIFLCGALVLLPVGVTVGLIGALYLPRIR